MAMDLATVSAQEVQPQQPATPHQRFWAGVNYSYMHAEMKLFSCIEHSIWQGLDYGADTLTGDDISSINSIARFTSENHGLTMEAGMNILDRPVSKWHIDGKVLLGIMRTKYTTSNVNTNNEDLVTTSPFSRITTGLEFSFSYAFNARWGVSATPLLSYTWGTATLIDDQLKGPVSNFTDDRKEKSQTVMSHLALMASYRTGKFTFSAGPGFYLAYNYRDYIINMTNPATGSTYNTETRSVFYNKYFADASIHVEWRIMPTLGANLFMGIGRDIMITPGIR